LCRAATSVALRQFHRHLDEQPAIVHVDDASGRKLKQEPETVLVVMSLDSDGFIGKFLLFGPLEPSYT
jgi:hypothetical protein